MFGRVAYEDEKMGPYLAHLGKLMRQGEQAGQTKIRPDEAALECFFLFGKHEALTLGIIANLFHRGVLETEKSIERRAASRSSEARG